MYTEGCASHCNWSTYYYNCLLIGEEEPCSIDNELFPSGCEGQCNYVEHPVLCAGLSGGKCRGSRAITHDMYPVDCDSCDWKNYYNDCLLAGHTPPPAPTTTSEPVPAPVLTQITMEPLKQAILVTPAPTTPECDQ